MIKRPMLGSRRTRSRLKCREPEHLHRHCHGTMLNRWMGPSYDVKCTEGTMSVSKYGEESSSWAEEDLKAREDNRVPTKLT